MQRYIYHEQQESALCGQHCLNNLLQGPYFTAPDLASIAEELDMQERLIGGQETIRGSANVDDSGNFSIQVLRKALETFNGIDLRVWFLKSGQDEDPTEQKGFIVNRSEHWIAIRKIHGKWWNLNSTNEKPELVSEFYLSALLMQLREDGYSVFIADGNVPESNSPESSGLYGSSAGKWYTEQEVLSGSASAPGQETAGFKPFQGKGRRLDGRNETESTSSAIDFGKEYDEDAAIARAIAASLEVPKTKVEQKEDLRAKRLAALSKSGMLNSRRKFSYKCSVLSLPDSVRSAFNHSHPNFKLLDECLLTLTSGKDEAARNRAAQDLKMHVELAARELSLERFAKFENELYQNILSYVNGNVVGEKIGGILAIRELIDCTSSSAETKVMKFAKNLSHALGASTDFALIELVADALGHMARNSPVSDVDYLESELNRSLDWLRAAKPTVHRRFAACTMLQQLATNAPTIFFARINEFFDLIWSPMWDHKESIRQSAGKALSACLAVLKERTYHLQWYCYIYDQLQDGFQNGSEESVHGSLIVVAEVLKYTGDFMIPRFKEVCKSIMRLKDHKSKIVRSAIISLLPSLADLCPDVFARAHMDEAVEFLFKCAKNVELRPQALLATGKLCLAVGPHLISRLDEVMNILREAFSLGKKGGKGTDVVPEALVCVSDMVQGLGAPFHDRIYLLLEPMLQSGLTPGLIDTLAVISSYMPNKKTQVQSRLLEEVTKILGGNSKPKLVEPDYTYSWGKRGERRLKASYNIQSSTPNDGMTCHVSGILQPVPSTHSVTSLVNSTSAARLSLPRPNSTKNIAGARPNSSSPAVNAPVTPVKVSKPKKGFSLFSSKSSNSTTQKHSSSSTAGMGVAAIGMGLGLGSETDPVAANQSNEIVLLSLKTLASLTIPYHNLIFIVQQSVIPYLNSDHYLVRKEAAMTCAKMVGNLVELSPSKGPTALAIEDIVNRLLEVAVSDTSTLVRLGVLKALNSDFDKYLARSHHIETIMLLLADELFDIKLEALNNLGRLAPKNAAAVLPPLRTHLNRLLSELNNSPDYRMIEEAATMLCNFMKFNKFHFLVRPIMQTLLESLPLRSNDMRATTSALETIGELSVVLQQELTPYADSLLPVIISNMFDSSSLKKQEVAVRTLGQFSRSTGLTVRPYFLYPQLLPKTLDLLCRNSTHKPISLRLEILRTLGLLGALEPSKYVAIVAFIQNYYKNKKTESSGEEIRPDKKMALQLASPTIAASSVADNARNMHEFIAKEKERERAESSMSFHDKILASGRAEPAEIVRHSDRRTGSGGLEADDLICSDTLLQGDNGDAPSYLFMYEQSVMRAISDPPHEKMILNKQTPGSPDFYPRVALSALLKILQDPALSVHHSTATQTIIQIFGGLGVRCVPFLEQIVPYFLQIVRKSATGLRESILQQLSQLVAIIGHYITPYLPAILDIMKEYWSDHLEHVLAIVQQVAITTSETFTTYLPTLLPLLLSSLSLPAELSYVSFRADHSVLKPLEEMLSAIKVLRVALRPHIHLFVPPLCKLMGELQDLGPETVHTQTLIVQTIRYLVTRSKGAVVEQSHVILGTLIHTICRSFIKYSTYHLTYNTEVYTESISTLAVLAQQCGPRMLKFDSLILRSTEGRNLDTFAYKEVSSLIRAGLWDEMSYADLEEGSPIAARNKDYAEESCLVSIMKSSTPIQDDIDDRTSMAFYNASSNAFAGIPKLLLNQQQLARSWDVSQRSTANDWHEWLWRFNVDLLRESPSPTLRACAQLAQAYPPIARELFHAAFVSCWHELSEPYQESLVRALQTAFKSSTIPSDILQHLLNLAEFMEHDVEALPISLSILAELAQKGHAYAKALHYRELEYQTNPAGCFENLININKKLDQYEAASGLLKVATQIQKKYPELKEFYTVQESWLAKLGYWDEALQKYDEKLILNPKDSIAIAGKMKCLESLGRWEDALKLCEDNLDRMRVESEATKTNTHTKAAVIGARAAWSLNEWAVMDNCISQLSPDNVDGSFLKAVLSVHSEDYAESRRLLEQTRKHLDKSISSLMTESYGRAYMPLIMAQQCSELEEITDYKLFLKDCNASDNANQVAVSSPNNLRDDGIQYLTSELDTYLGPPRRINRHENLSMHLSLSDESAVQSTSVSNVQLMEQEANRRKSLLSEKWRRRIRGCASSGRAAIPFWKHLLNGRKMVLEEREDLDTWLEFISLCRNVGNFTLADRILNMCKSSVESYYATNQNTSDKGSGLLDDDSALVNRRIKFAMMKQQWSIGEKHTALQGLAEIVRGIRSNPSSPSDHSYLRCLLKLGEWKVSILDPGQVVDASTRQEVLSLYSKATAVDPNSYRAWHQWGLSNYRAIEEAKAAAKMNNSDTVTKSSKTPAIPKEQLVSFSINAIKGFMRALMLGTRKYSSSVTQDMLCILSLWFSYGKMPEVNAALQAGIATVPLDNWLGVLPQLIARIDHPDLETRQLLHRLLVRIGVKHAQALVYPLSVALKSPRGERKEAAELLMNGLRQHSNKLIDQALLVSQELVRVAILWEENWHWALEEASRQYFGDGNIQAMLNTLLPLHDAVEAGATTMREVTFIENYRTEISQAAECLRTYTKTMTEKNLPIPSSKSGSNQADAVHIAQAWDFYYSMFKKINAQLPHINALELQSCSPALFAATDLDLGVPGTYTVSTNAIRIKSFSPVVQIIRSKQRPRRVRVIGEDGQEFGFLLKGHEDLRQDERAMQLFGLVNALLYHDRITGVNGDDLQIQRYAVIPVSPVVGLIGWVPNCDTLHDLVRNYRDSRKIMLDVEHRLILQVAPNKLYDSLPTMHKLEVFEYAMNYTAGEDLAKILWLKSDNSESWLQRRTTYTRSLAVMSMVGYILGLGDRHPSNLMLDRKTGKILHIDFGDCFEVAKYRDKYPERVPFRLTRMLVNAMEVARIEGNFRSTCEKVMTVLRENRDSLVATLEAFVHDPLISWRLMNINPKTTQKTPPKPDSQVSATSKPADPSPTPAIIVSKPRKNTARSLNMRGQFINTLEPIEEQHLVEDKEEVSPVPADREQAAPSPPKLIQPSSLLTGQMNNLPVQDDQNVDLMPLVSKGLGFAEHSAANDIVASSYQRSMLKQQASSITNIAGGIMTSNIDLPIMNSTASIAIETSGRSGKTVSFSHTNQTIEADNTIRASSVSLAIHPIIQTEVNEDNEFVEGSAMLINPAAIAITRAKADSTNNPSNAVEINSVVSSQRPGTNANLHLEMSSLAQSVGQIGSKIMSMSGRHSFLRADAVLSQDTTSNDDQQLELTEKAVVVIRRVRDKLTGLDFPDALTGHHVPALAVPEQVERLIKEATSNENLSQSFFGWCPYW